MVAEEGREKVLTQASEGAHNFALPDVRSREWSVPVVGEKARGSGRSKKVRADHVLPSGRQLCDRNLGTVQDEGGSEIWAK